LAFLLSASCRHSVGILSAYRASNVGIRVGSLSAFRRLRVGNAMAEPADN